MSLVDSLGLLHPAIAILVVFPLLGIVMQYALQTRQRRLAIVRGEKSKIAPTVGAEHLKLGRYLSNAVVAIALLGLAHPILSKMVAQQAWATDTVRFWFVLLMFGLAIATLVCLNRAQPAVWRAVFAVLTGMALWLLGSQPEVFRREFEWQYSHYYYGMIAAMLMIFALAIFPDIYRDRSLTWRKVHIALSVIALLFLIGQGFTGTRDLLEIPLKWQEPYVQQLYKQNCQTQPCSIQRRK